MDRQRPYAEEWPPNQPSSVVNLALIHYKCSRTQSELVEISKRSKGGASHVDKLTSSHSNVTTDIKKLFSSNTATGNKLPKRILIEGAPGIGKTVLSKEVAYQWANGKILKEYQLVFLMYLRDPRLYTVKSVNQILELFTSENTPELEKYVNRHRGINVAFVFDGFDEYPAKLREQSFITDLIKGVSDDRIFLNSTVVVTSRPIATLFLHGIVDRRIEILGFPKKERDEFISVSLNDTFDKKQELDQYLKQHSIINNLCYIPLHLSILMYLFLQDSLPETLTEMNESFILNTIYRYLERHRVNLPGVVKKITSLPTNITTFLYQLSKLAYDGLVKDQLVFTYEEIKEACPEVDNIPGGINGFGLLQAIQHYPKKGIGKTTSVNFLHYTMQEYLAALHVTVLSNKEQSFLMKKTFWEGHYSFMWVMYVGIVGVESNTFESFITSDDAKSDNSFSSFFNKDEASSMTVYSDIKKCLHLFQCYIEAKSELEMPREVSSIFTDGKIILNGTALLPHHISSLLFFMSVSSKQQWKTLELRQCNLRDIGMHSLLEHVMKNDQNISTLEHVDLSQNDSSPWSVYCIIIRHSCVNSLTLCGDKGVKEYIKDITDSLQTNTTLQALTLLAVNDADSSNNMFVEEIRKSQLQNSLVTNGKMYFNALIDDCEKINVTGKSRIVDITILYDGDCKCSPETISLSGKNIDDDTVCLIAFGLCNNTIVKKLDLSCNTISESGMNRLSEFIVHSVLLEYVDLSQNHSSPWGVYCTIIRYCQVNSLTLCGDKGMKEYVKEITDSLQANVALHSLTLCKIGITGVQSVESMLNDTFPLKELNLSWESDAKGKKILNRRLELNNKETVILNLLCDINYEFSSKTINWSSKSIDDNAVYLLTFVLQSFETLKRFNLSENIIGNVGMNKILEHAKQITSLEYVNLNNNPAPPWSVYCSIIKYSIVNSLILYGDKEMNQHVKDIIDSLQKNTTLQSLTLCEIGNTGVKSIESILKSRITLKELNLSWGSNANGTKILNRQYTSQNKKRISVNILCDDYYHESLSKNIALSKMNIDDDAVCLIAFGLHNNTTVKELDLSCNSINAAGIKKLSKCTSSLEYINLSRNPSFPWSVYCASIRHFRVRSLTLCGGIEGNIRKTMSNLQINATLQSLTLCDIITSTAEIMAIKSILIDNTTLKEFNASWKNKETTVTCGKLISYKIENRKLTTNNYRFISFDNNINDIVRHFMCGWQYDIIVQKLDISHNNITDDGAVLISDCLKYNNVLKELNLSHNQINLRGITKLSKCTKNATLLEYVDLSVNKTSPWCMYCSIIKRCSISSLTLCGDEGIKQYTKEITDSLHQNATLRSLTLLACRSNLGSYKDKIAKEDNMKELQSILVIDGKLFFDTLVNDDVSIPSSNDSSRVVDIKILYDVNCKCIPETICLPNMDIHDDMVSLIAFGLYNNTAIKKIDLSHNNLSINGMKKLSECIKHRTPLEYVDLSGNVPSPWGVYCAIIRHCCANTLTFCGDKGIKEYVKEITSSLQSNATLQSLTLYTDTRDNTDRYHNVVVKANNTETLELQGILVIEGKNFNTLVNGEEMETSKREINIYINILYESDSECTPEAICLSSKDINDDTVCLLAFGLCNNIKIKQLDLSYNSISMNGMNRLSECVKHAIQLEYVDLSENQSSPWGAYCAIIRHCCVTSIALCGDQGMKEYAKEITDSLQVNKTLKSLILYASRSNEGRYKEKINYIKKSHGWLVINGRLSFYDDEKVTSSSRVVYIKILYDADCSGSPEFLCLSGKNVNDDTACLIAFGLYNNTTVKELDFSHNKISVDGMNKLSESIRHPIPLEYVDLSGNKASPWHAYCDVIRYCCVGDLTLCGDEGMEKYVKEIGENLQANLTLQSLTLCQIGKTGVQSIKHILNSNVTLIKELNLSWKGKGITIIHRKLTFKKFNSTPLDLNDHKGVLKINVLYDADHECSTEAINMSNRRINDDAVYVITFGLYNNTTVQKLDLSCNNISDNGAVAISDCFKSTLSLQILILSKNKISCRGAKAISEIIQVNEVIRKLDLSHNNIQDDGAIAICKSLTTNNTLKELNLSNNLISSEGAKKIADAIQANKGLHKLDVSQFYL